VHAVTHASRQTTLACQCVTSESALRDVLRQNCAFYPLTQPDTHPGPMTSQRGSGCHGGPCSSTNIHLAQGSRLGMGALAAEELLVAFLLLKRIFSLDDSDKVEVLERSDDRLCPTYRSPSLSFMNALPPGKPRSH
jgi:hypothetical protein